MEIIYIYKIHTHTHTNNFPNMCENVTYKLKVDNPVADAAWRLICFSNNGTIAAKVTRGPREMGVAAFLRVIDRSEKLDAFRESIKHGKFDTPIQLIQCRANSYLCYITFDNCLPGYDYTNMSSTGILTALNIRKSKKWTHYASLSAAGLAGLAALATLAAGWKYRQGGKQTARTLTQINQQLEIHQLNMQNLTKKTDEHE